jgi:hypothetical protein
MILNIFFTDEAHFTRSGVNITRNSHSWGCDNPHGTVESKYQHLFFVNVWCGVTGEQLTGPYIFLQYLTGDTYAISLQDKLPTVLENVPVQTRQMYYQHDGARSAASFQPGRQAVSES